MLDWSHFHSMERDADANVPSIPVQSLPIRRHHTIISFCIWGMALWTAFCVYGTVHGIYRVSRLPLPTNEWQQAGQEMGFLIGMGIWAMAWFIPTVGLGVITLVTHVLRKRS